MQLKRYATAPKMCAKCNKSLKSNHLQSYQIVSLEDPSTSITQHFHVNCFRCISCNQLIDVQEYEEGPKCAKCFSRDSPVCYGCREPILVAAFIKAFQKCWHESCLKCFLCGGSVASHDGYMNDLKGKPQHLTCRPNVDP